MKKETSGQAPLDWMLGGAWWVRGKDRAVGMTILIGG
jgi:hypothetical protein